MTGAGHEYVAALAVAFGVFVGASDAFEISTNKRHLQRIVHSEMITYTKHSYMAAIVYTYQIISNSNVLVYLVTSWSAVVEHP